MLLPITSVCLLLGSEVMTLSFQSLLASGIFSFSFFFNTEKLSEFYKNYLLLVGIKRESVV